MFCELWAPNESQLPEACSTAKMRNHSSTSATSESREVRARPGGVFAGPFMTRTGPYSLAVPLAERVRNVLRNRAIFGMVTPLETVLYRLSSHPATGVKGI